MKIAKMIRTVTALALLAFAAVSIRTSMMAKEGCDELQDCCEELNGRIEEMRTMMGSLSDQIKRQSEQLDVMHKEANDCMADSEEKTERESVSCFIVREYEGIIGVFDESNHLVRCENVTVSSLSDSDRQDLEIGIRVESTEELEKLIEDMK